MTKLAAILIFCVFLLSVCSSHTQEKSTNRHAHHSEKHYHNRYVHHQARESKSRHANYKNVQHPLLTHNRANNLTSENITSVLANSSGTNNEEHLFFCYHYSTKFEIYNQTTRYGISSDINYNITFIYKENSNFIVAFNYTSKTGFFLNNSNLKSSGENWRNYLSNVKCLKDLYDRGAKSGTPFNATSSSSHNSDLQQATESFSDRYRSFCDLILDLQKTSCALRRLSKAIGNVQGDFPVDFQQIAKRLQSVECYFGQFMGQNGNFNLNQILSQPSGIQTLFAILQELRDGFNPTQIFGNGWNATQFFSMIEDLAGRYNRLDGFLRVVSELRNSSSGTFCPENFIDFLMQFYRNRSCSNQNLESSLRNLTNGNQWNDLDRFLPGINNVLQGFGRQNESTSSPDFNNFISGMIRNNNNNNPLSNIIRALSLLPRNFFTMWLSIPTLMARLVSMAVSSSGQADLQNIIPNLNLSQFGSPFDFQSQMTHAFEDAIQSNNISCLWSNNSPLRIFFSPVNMFVSFFTNGALTVPRLFVKGGSFVVRVFFQALLTFVKMAGRGFETFISLIERGVSLFGNAAETAIKTAVDVISSPDGGPGENESGGNELMQSFQGLLNANNKNNVAHSENHNLKGKEKHHQDGHKSRLHQ